MLTRIESQGDAASRELAYLDNEPWQRALAPVQVVRCEAPFEVEVRLPAGTARVRWRLQLEDGSERRGDASFADLALVSSRSAAAAELECRRLPLAALPMGYHRLELEPNGGAMSVIAAPERCWLPDGESARFAGVAAQLYLLRSERNWGIGDFEDLRQLVRMVADSGGAAVGVNPLHALFVDNPAHASPYGPSSRLLLNVLNIAVESVPEYASSARARALVDSPEFRSRLQQCRAAALVDFESVARAKLEVLELLFDEAREARGTRWQAFAEFRRERGPAFSAHCLYLAVRRHLAATLPNVPHWRDWPGALGDSQSQEVAEFAREHVHEIEREAWLQFVADEQLEAASKAAKMPIGVYRDLAVGSDSSGAETWSDPDLIALGVQVGAPPDDFNAAGQNWGLPPWSPRRLRERGYEPFVSLLRANMRHAGALRIDHAMALERLFWIPEGRDARDGEYVAYPRDDLFAIVALESHRARCMVVGEDLGTVPPQFRERMAAASMLSYRVLRFENRDGGPIPPAEYPRLALAVAGNHDLATLKAWWGGADLELQLRHGVLAAAQAEEARRARAQERDALVEALRRERLLERDDFSFDELRSAVHRYLGRTEAMLALVQIEDIAAQEEPVNVPNIPDYPSWRRRVGPSLEELAAGGTFAALLEALTAERPPAAVHGARRAD
jgi:4-alpha-glucanotransferase